MAPHFILTLGRSGSNTLVNAFNQHPEILNYGEVLGDWNRIRRLQRRLAPRLGDDRYLDLLMEGRAAPFLANLGRSAAHAAGGRLSSLKRFRRIRSVGVKEFSLNMRRCGLPGYLAERPRIRVIGLRRSAVLERLVSWQMLDATGVIAAPTEGAGAGARRRLRLDPDRLQTLLETVEAENRELDALLDGLGEDRVLRIDYEEMYRGEEAAVAAIRAAYAFLGVADFRPEIRMRKIIPGASLDAIANLDECRDRVRGTRFEPLFRASA
jgi:LPS sulfotransferase NodH